jgi:membrane-associated phospholipid phosphatase
MPHERTRHPWTVAGIIVALSVIAAVSIFTFDAPAAAWSREHTRGWFGRPWADPIKQLGKPVLPCLLIFAWASAARRWRAAVTVMLALLLVLVAINVIKPIVHRPRPYDRAASSQAMTFEKVFSRSWSFPSGDTAQSFAILAALTPFLGATGFTIVLAGASIVGVNRVLGGFHYPSDVLMGAVAGILCGCLALLIARRFLGHDPPQWWPKSLGYLWDQG